MSKKTSPKNWVVLPISDANYERYPDHTKWTLAGITKCPKCGLLFETNYPEFFSEGKTRKPKRSKILVSDCPHGKPSKFDCCACAYNEAKRLEKGLASELMARVMESVLCSLLEAGKMDEYKDCRAALAAWENAKK